MPVVLLDSPYRATFHAEFFHIAQTGPRITQRFLPNMAASSSTFRGLERLPIPKWPSNASYDALPTCTVIEQCASFGLLAFSSQTGGRSTCCSLMTWWQLIGMGAKPLLERCFTASAGRSCTFVPCSPAFQVACDLFVIDRTCSRGAGVTAGPVCVDPS